MPLTPLGPTDDPEQMIQNLARHIDAHFDGLSEALRARDAKVDVRFDRTEARLDRMEARLERIEEGLAALRSEHRQVLEAHGNALEAIAAALKVKFPRRWA